MPRNNSKKDNNKIAWEIIISLSSIVACVAAVLVVPEIRLFLGLDKPPGASATSPANSVNARATPLALAQQWPVKLPDDFSGSTMEDWPYIFNQDTSAVNEMIDSIRIIVEPHGEVQTFYYKRLKSNLDDNFLLSIDSAGKEQTGCSYGLLFRIDNDYNFYYFKIDNGVRYKLLRYFNESWTEPVPQKDIPFGDEVSSISVLGKGINYDLYINNRFVDEFEDESVRGFRAGIAVKACQYLDKAKFVFDNFIIRTP